MIRIYGMADSGNCYKPRLLLAMLGQPFEHVETSSRDGTTRSPAFLAKNANGKVPLLELEDGRFLAESNAILLYLGEGSRFVPFDPYERALVYQWLFFEQYSHEPLIAVRRSLVLYPERAALATPERMASLLDGGHKALGVMEARLAVEPWLVGDEIGVADIALFAYTQHADIAGYDMARFPGVVRWLDRVKAAPGYVDLDWKPAQHSAFGG
ncbi:glutathione S-transferase family protein [Mesorhizobium australicum]|uniref:Glutathione S-transferase n=1 Tax=Mesorhizobium australicum TaxID=536018 RepID=A0A1X7PH67_9HYPH|nr:glutathione S-transferase family protein [Mesorhizobium australicum]SMH50893.1 glutathione S-transferase [Mesorhizobium australicum]